MKRGFAGYWGVCAFLLAISALFLYTILASPAQTAYALYEQAGTLQNPVLHLSDDEALREFNSSYVFFLLYYAHAYELHNAPLSSIAPTIQIVVDDEMYTADIVNGIIHIMKGTALKPDITLSLSHLTLIRLLRNPALLSDAFNDGRATITVHASKPELFARGYVSLYSHLLSQSAPRIVVKLATE